MSRGPRLGLIGGLLLGGLAALFLAAAALADPPLSEREQAVAEARAGHPDIAIAELRRLLAAGTSDPLVAMDLAVLLHQSGDAKAATDVFERAGMAVPPEYALMAMTRAYRDQGRYDAAEKLARAGMKRFPAEAAWPVLLSLILADSGRSDEALRLLSGPAAAGAAPAERKLAEAHALRRGGRPMEALRAYMDALRLDPGSRAARDESASLLREIGAPNAAAALVDAAPPTATGAARLPLRADQAAAKVRWGADIRSSDPRERFAGTDAAIADLDRLIAAAEGDPVLLTRLRLDRMVALRDRKRMNDVIAEGNALRAAGHELPPYAEHAFADALLRLKQPKAARDAYAAVVKAEPRNLGARYGVFYAEVELEDFDAAYRTIDTLLADQPPWVHYGTSPSRHANLDYSYAAMAAGLARLYGDQLGEAQDRIAPLVASAPANAEFRRASAAVMAARGWPRAAEREAKVAQSLDPTSTEAEKTLASLDLEFHRFSAAEARIRKLEAVYPEDTQLKELARNLEAERGAVFELEVRPSWSRGGGTNQAGNELTVSARLWSPPIATSWRAFVFDDYSYAHPIEGFVERHHAGAGAELRLSDVTATAYGTYSTGELEKPGGGFTLDWQANDQLRLGLAGEIFSIGTPLRALFEDVTGNEIGGHIGYRWHESREISLSSSYLDVSDGNQRESVGLDFSQRLVDIPHFDLTGRLGAFGSTNSKQDVAYYSPERDLTATVGLLAEHVLWRSYHNGLVQAFTLDAGAYAQEGIGTDWIATVAYEHRWQFNPMTSFHYGVLLTRRVYDGDPELSVALTFGLTRRF